MNYSEEENEKNNESLILEIKQSNTDANNKQNDIEINKYHVPSNETESNENNDNKKNEFIVLNLNTELKEDMDKTNELKDKSDMFEVICKGEKHPTTWVQFNQVYGKSSPHYGDEGGSGGGMDYDPSSRNHFVRFVFMILLIMLIVTAGFCLIVLTTPSLKTFYKRAGLIMMLSSMGVLLLMNFVMICMPMARVPPCNFISLIIVVVATSNLLASITVRYKTHILLLGMIATVITVSICVILACSNFDFTEWYIYVVVLATVFMAISLVVTITMLVMKIKYKPLTLALSFISSLIHSVILIMELQMILGGRKIELDEDDYALGAYMLYTSIIDIFIRLLHVADALN